MNRSSILSEMVKAIKRLDEKQTLYILKGFNFISDQLEQLDFLFLKNEVITEIHKIASESYYQMIRRSSLGMRI